MTYHAATVLFIWYHQQFQTLIAASRRDNVELTLTSLEMYRPLSDFTSVKSINTQQCHPIAQNIVVVFKIDMIRAYMGIAATVHWCTYILKTTRYYLEYLDVRNTASNYCKQPKYS